MSGFGKLQEIGTALSEGDQSFVSFVLWRNREEKKKVN